MEYIKTCIDGVWIIEPKVFNDARGYFFEAWKKDEFEEHVGKVSFVQDNESKSSYGVLRGLHYQKGDFSQAKLVRVIKRTGGGCRCGHTQIVCHIRKICHGGAKRGKQTPACLIPRGFAHGFLVLSDEAVFTYKVDNVYAPQHEASIRWNDETIDIKWPIDINDIKTSEKDLTASRLARLICSTDAN